MSYSHEIHSAHAQVQAPQAFHRPPSCRISCPGSPNGSHSAASSPASRQPDIYCARHERCGRSAGCAEASSPASWQPEHSPAGRAGPRGSIQSQAHGLSPAHHGWEHIACQNKDDSRLAQRTHAERTWSIEGRQGIPSILLTLLSCMFPTSGPRSQHFSTSALHPKHQNSDLLTTHIRQPGIEISPYEGEKGCAGLDF